MRNMTIALYAAGRSVFRTKLHGIRFLLVLMMCITGSSLTVMAGASDLDPAFGSGGKASWSPNDNTESRYGSGMALQPDGKIVMVGGSTETGGTPVFMVARFNADGSIDTTFGTGGTTTVSFGSTSETALSVDIQPDGKIVAAGRINPTDVDIAIARLNSDGSLDTTFSGDGKLTVGFSDLLGFGYADFVNVVKVAGNGKIVFAGQSGPGPNLTYARHIGRLNADGSFDTTFDTDGKLFSGMGSGVWTDLIAKSDGTIYAAGYVSTQTGSSIFVAKYNDNGSQAWSYSRGRSFGCYMLLNGLAEQTDGKLVAVGTIDCAVGAIRINTDGSLDTTFSSPAVPNSERASSVAIQADGKILTSFYFSSLPWDGFSLVRFNTDGSFDPGFGIGGVARVHAFNGFEFARDMAIQPDGKILLGGSSSVEFSSEYRFAMVRYLGAAAASQTPLFDYDGDGKADISVFRPSENKWYIYQSSDGQVRQNLFAMSGDVAVPADYDGDGITEAAVFRPSSGDWWYLSSIDSAQVYSHWGQAGDIPRPSDFDGDGKTDFVVYRPSSSIWYRLSATGEMSSITFGTAEDKPLVGDFDGDGKSDPAVYRPSTGDWWYAVSSAGGGHRVTHWGVSTDIPAPGDYDGDGKTDLAVYRPSQGAWYILNSGGASPTIIGFGLAEDKPVPADYDGDGRVDIAVFRPSTGLWYLLRSTAGFTAMQFGISTDIPTPGAFIP